MTSQEQFEAWAQETPREWGIEKQTVQGTFPGQYRAYHVQAAWEAWEARSTVDQEQEPVAWNVTSEGRKHGLHRLEKDAQKHVGRLQSHPFCTIAIKPKSTPLYAHPIPACELTDEEIINALDGKVGTQFLTTPVTCKEFWLTAGSVDVREFVRAIERSLKKKREMTLGQS